MSSVEWDVHPIYKIYSVVGVGGKRKKESPSKSLGGVCRPHRMWLPSGLKYM